MADAEDTVFLLAGPVRMHPRVIRAMAAPTMNHRGREFREVLRDVRTLTQYLFQTKSPVAVLSGSGTAGLEAAVAGLLRKKDRVLNCVNGKFSERFHDLCKVFADATAINAEWGRAVDPKAVAEAMAEGHYAAITVCHNETSTGVTNPLRDLAKVARTHDALLIVDGITSVGGIEARMEWGVDAIVVGSQKCAAAPPGLAAVAVSDRAYDRLHEDSSFYTSLKAHLDALEEDDTPFTPAVPLFLAWREALRLLKEEGLENRIRRTATLGDATRAAAKSIDLDLLAEEQHASNTVTAIRYPPGVDDKKFRDLLWERHRTIVSGGQDLLKGKIFRVGHMGIVTLADLAAGFVGIEATLVAMGHSFDRGAALAEIARRA